MKKTITLYPAYDKRHPDPSKNYGIHGVDLLFVLEGKNGAVQFKLFTNWQLPHVTEEFLNKSHMWTKDKIDLYFFPMPADLGYHSKVPHYEGHEKISRECEWTGGDCYYDGSTLNAEPIYEILLREGSEGIWQELEKYYKDIFGEDKQ